MGGCIPDLEQVRLAPASTSAEYLRMFSDCFPETAGTPLSTEAHYLWKYGSAGKAAPVFEYGAYEDHEMVGYYAALPFAYSGPSGPILGGMVCDVMTHSSRRGRGIFTQQGLYATSAMGEAGVDFVLGFPIRESVLPGHLKVGWKVAFGLPVYFALVDPHPVLSTKRIGWLGVPARSLCSAYRLALRPGRGDAGECERVPALSLFRSREYDEFQARWGESYPVQLIRTSEFFCWRLSAPQACYQVVAFRIRGRLGAVAITRPTHLHGFDVLAIVDMMVLPEFRSAIGRLHEEIARIARESGAAAVVTMTTRPDARFLRLGRNGFLRSPVEFKLILKWLSRAPVPPSLWEAKSWHLAWADTDNL
jgi:hypothetical protein